MGGVAVVAAAVVASAAAEPVEGEVSARQIHLVVSVVVVVVMVSVPGREGDNGRRAKKTQSLIAVVLAAVSQHYLKPTALAALTGADKEIGMS